MQKKKGEIKMKKFKEIIEEIKGLEETVKELKEKENEANAKYRKLYEGTSLKDRVKNRNFEKEAEIIHEIQVLKETIDDTKIKQMYLRNNAKIALFNEVTPIVLEVLKKYKGKPYGEKTSKKIREEVKEQTGCIFYISSKYGITNCYELSPANMFGNTYNITCGTKYIKGENKPLLVNNKIQEVSMEDLELCYINRTYYDDIDTTIEKLKELHEKARTKQKELEEIVSQYNTLAVDGLQEINLSIRHIGDIV